MNRKLEELSRDELLLELRKLEELHRQYQTTGATDPTRLVHELGLHEVELEVQNRELREAQRVVEESRARYAELYDFAPVGYCTLDLYGAIRDINITGAELLGHSREALVGSSLLVGAPAEQRQRFVEHVARCLRSSEPTTTEIELSSRRRGPIVIRLVSQPAYRGDTTELRSALVDISESRALEDRLRFLDEVGETFATSLDYQSTLSAVARLAVPHLADICFVDVVNGNGKLRRAEMASADARHRPMLETLRTASWPQGWQSPQHLVVASREPFVRDDLAYGQGADPPFHSAEAEALRGVGARGVMIVPLVARNRALGVATFVATSATRRYSASELAFAEDYARRGAMALDNALLHERAQREWHNREAFLGAASHDLRTPLGSILMTTGRALRDPPADARETTAAFVVVDRAAKRMKRMIDDLLDSAAIDAGHLTIHPAPQSAHVLVRDVIDAMTEQARAASLRLEGDTTGTILVACDRDRILQVLSNLVGNAIKFTGPGGAIRVRAACRGAVAVFSVDDTGRGIAREELQRVFDRFWQARASGRLGAGLGLSISRGIVETHGGELWAESELGVGSSFSFTLPLAQGPSVAGGREETAGAGSSPTVATPAPAPEESDQARTVSSRVALR